MGLMGMMDMALTGRKKPSHPKAGVKVKSGRKSRYDCGGKIKKSCGGKIKCK